MTPGPSQARRRPVRTRSPLALSQIVRAGLVDQEYEIAALQEIGARSGQRLLGFDIADPSDRTPDRIVRAMVRALERPDATHYTRIRGLPAFVESVAEVYSRTFGVDIDPLEQVLATCSSEEGLFLAFFAMVTPGAEFIVPNPTFPAYGSLLRLLGGVATFVPTATDFHLDVEAIARAVTKATKAIVLCTPNNPTGAVYTRDELQQVLRIAERHGLVVISDENYSRITYDGHRHCSIASLPGAMERTIVVNGFSKVYAMTGWRLGYVIARADLIAQLEKIAYEIRGPVNTAVQYAGRAALRTSDAALARIVRAYDRKRKLLVSGLRAAGLTCHMPEGGFEALARVPAGFGDGTAFARYLVEATGVLVKPGSFFGPDGEGYVRLVYCRDERLIHVAVERIARALATGTSATGSRARG